MKIIRDSDMQRIRERFAADLGAIFQESKHPQRLLSDNLWEDIIAKALPKPSFGVSLRHSLFRKEMVINTHGSFVSPHPKLVADLGYVGLPLEINISSLDRQLSEQDEKKVNDYEQQIAHAFLKEGAKVEGRWIFQNNYNYVNSKDDPTKDKRHYSYQREIRFNRSDIDYEKLFKRLDDQTMAIVLMEISRNKPKLCEKLSDIVVNNSVLKELGYEISAPPGSARNRFSTAGTSHPFTVYKDEQEVFSKPYWQFELPSHPGFHPIPQTIANAIDLHLAPQPKPTTGTSKGKLFGALLNLESLMNQKNILSRYIKTDTGVVFYFNNVDSYRAFDIYLEYAQKARPDIICGNPKSPDAAVCIRKHPNMAQPAIELADSNDGADVAEIINTMSRQLGQGQRRY